MWSRKKLIEAIMAEADQRWMQKAVKRPGAFTAKATAAGRTVPQHTAYVKAHPDQFDTRTKRQANLARVFSKARKS
jgi:hypothetical protein